MFNVLKQRERKIIKAIAEVLIPLSSSKHTLTMDKLVERVEEQLRLMNREMALLYRLCLWLMEITGFFYYACCLTMTKMDLELRERYLNAWHHTWWSLKRTIKRFLETVIFMNYYSLPEVEKNICGYTPRYEKSLAVHKLKQENLLQEIPTHDIFEEVDVCVIGSGAGGAVVAKELADKGHSVVIIEEGALFTQNDYGKDVVTMTKMLYRSSGVINTFGWPPILVPIGKCVGGTTLINSGTCFRTPEKVFENWVERFGLHNWTSKELKKHYSAIEQFVGIAEATPNQQGKSAQLFEKGLKKLGHEMKPLLRNAPQCCGSGVCCFGCPTNAKHSVDLNYIPSALENGARLFTNCRARRIVYKNRHATHLEAQFIDPKTQSKRTKLTVKARIIVCACGSLHTPVLLKQSHVPNPSGQIGHNLTLHPAAKVMALFDEQVKGWQGIPQGYYSEALNEEGICLEGIFLQPAYVASTLLLTGSAHRKVMEQYNNLALFGMMISDTSRGRVLKGWDGHALSLYNINSTDLPKYRRGLQFLADAFFEAGAKEVFLPLHTLPRIIREEGIRPIIELKLRNKDLDLQAFHPLGTCRMGADPREAVIDPFGRVYGLDNLFVADGSIFPTSLGVNPMLTIMAAARKIAGHIHREFL
jgi:choline dehydrogenase-like flavoprotein